MDIVQLQERLRNEFGWRIGEETAAYILARLPAGGAIPILASDARTGRAISIAFDPAVLNSEKKTVAKEPPVKPAPKNDRDGQFLLFPG